MTVAQEPRLPRIHPWALAGFRMIVRRYFRRHFRSVMLLGAERMRGLRGPLIVYGNHSSWWDPLLSIFLAQSLLPGRLHYAPMDAVSLARYGIFRRLGVFPVEMQSTRGATQFLRSAQAILETGGVLWVTPQGRFSDPREPQLDFMPGLAALALRMPSVKLLPLAVEYTFWNERLPEALGCCSEALPLSDAACADVTAANAELESRLVACMTSLRQVSVLRVAAPFEVLLHGGRGTGGFYGLVKRLRRLLPGSKADSIDHSEREERRASR